VFIEEYKKERTIFNISAEDIVDVFGKLPEWIKDINPFDNLIRWIKETYRTVFNYFIYQLQKAMIVSIADYQMALKNNMNASIDALKAATKETLTTQSIKSSTIAEIEHKIRQATKKSAQDALLGNYLRNNNPSHTMLAKDSASHPIHTLSGKMAIMATTRLLDQVALSKNANVKNWLPELIAHPLFTTYFDSTTKDWAKKHPSDILRLCITSYTFETLRTSIMLLDKTHKDFSSLPEDVLIAINKFAKSEDNGIAQTIVNKIGETNKNLKAQLQDLSNAYKKSYYKELDGAVFVEWYNLYAKNNVFHKRTDVEQLKEEWLKKMDKALSNTSNTFKVPDGYSTIQSIQDSVTQVASDGWDSLKSKANQVQNDVSNYFKEIFP
jgi:predicted mannosyl-3-phosphoglycerate phosphatase (HAD superfamily)